jgi:hypothetical protein
MSDDRAHLVSRIAFLEDRLDSAMREVGRVHEANEGLGRLVVQLKRQAQVDTDALGRVRALCDEADENGGKEPFYAWVRCSDLRAALSTPDTDSGVQR